MWLALLGPLQVRDGDADLTIPAAKQRVLLAALLLHANHVLSFDELAETIWEDDPGPGAPATIRDYVRRLRQGLGPVIGARIVTRDPGYLIEVGEDELDLLRFERRCRDGGSAARSGDWHRAASALDEALALWRGAPLADIPSRRLQRDEVPPLAQARLQALEWRFEAQLQLGRHAETLAALEAASALHPLRERFHVLLMLALYRCGRQADALAAYRAVRRTLVGELGIEPGPELRDTHERILRADPGLVSGFRADSITRPDQQENHQDQQVESFAPAGAPTQAGVEGPDRQRVADRVIPRQLPARAAHFAGREAELNELSKLLVQFGPEPPAQVIAVIGGIPGIGKTALAVHWAHRVAEHFPDGQLYVNLRGFDPAGAPVRWPDAVRGFLDALAVPASRVPTDADARASLYRSLLADKRMLVVLDNARDEQHVRPLIPGGPECRVVVTSRNDLAGLAASHGAQCITLDVLSQNEARDLLARHVGPKRLAAEPAAVGEVIAHCARLPLALAISAARTSTGARRSLAELASELHESQGRLDALDLADSTMSVRSVFACSFAALSEPAGRLFRLLGISPGPDISIAGAASLAGCDRNKARRLLRELTGACLLTEPTPGRFACHDLLRVYAAELAVSLEPRAERQSALHRLLDYYLETGVNAALQFNPARRRLEYPAPLTGVTGDVFADKASAQSWLEAERIVLLAATTKADEEGFDGHAWRLPWTLSDYFSYRGHWPEWHAAQLTAAAAAERSGDVYGQAVALRLLGQAAATLGDHDEARRCLEKCIPFYDELDDPMGQSAGHLDCARICVFQDQFADAVRHALEGLKYARAAGQAGPIAAALNGVGWCLAKAGEPERALSYCEESVELQREVGNGYGEALARDSVGYIHHLLGDHDEAVGSFRLAVAGFVATGDRLLEANSLDQLADAYLATGRRPEAEASWRRALAIMEELEHTGSAAVRAKLTPLTSPGGPPCPPGPAAGP
jgi:DNA-binding SARP family transcriptional activator